MTMSTRLPRLIAAFVFAVTALIAAQDLLAQATFTNPPCPAIKVVNNNPCTATVTLVTNPAGLWPSFNIPGGTAVLLAMPAPPSIVQVTGIVIPPFGPAVAFNPPPAPVAVCGPNAWWAVNLPLNPAATCRFTVCVDPSTCSITLW